MRKPKLATTDSEVDSALERIDDKVIVQSMVGAAIQDYIYSFRQGGRVIEGLTLAGINEAANQRGGIEVDDIQHKETETSWVAIVRATDTVKQTSRYGAFEQHKIAYGKPDPFAFTKAIHKAQRNAIKQLLPVSLLTQVLKHYKEGNHETKSN